MLPGAVKDWVAMIREKQAKQKVEKRNLAFDLVGVAANELRPKGPKLFEAVVQELIDKPPPGRRERRWQKKQRGKVHLLAARRAAIQQIKVKAEIKELKNRTWWWGRGGGHQHDAHVKEPRSAFESGQAYSRFLQKRGFSLIGEGHYSMVFHKKGERVIKVNKHGTPDGWVDYVLWAAKAGYAGKHAPRVYSYKFHKGRKSNFYVAVMEKMEYASHKIDAELPTAILPSLLQYQKNPKAKEFVEQISPGLWGFQRELEKKFKGHMDMHGGNFMYRKDGSYVWTDPVSGDAKTTQTRFKVAA